MQSEELTTMRILWIILGIAAIFRLSQELCAYYLNDPKAIIIVGNCAMPVLAAFLVMLINEYKHLVAPFMEEDE